MATARTALSILFLALGGSPAAAANCVAGKYSADGTDGSGVCTDCPIGYFKMTRPNQLPRLSARKIPAGTGQAACSACQAGKFALQAGRWLWAC